MPEPLSRRIESSSTAAGDRAAVAPPSNRAGNHRLSIQPAADGDITSYLRIRDAAAEQMVTDGIVQWRPGELTESRLRSWVGDGEVFAARLDGELVGGFLLMWDDTAFWGETDEDAGYIHGLLVDRRLKGGGWGGQLLAVAEETIRDHGRQLARLDTVTANEKLRGYYLRAGYREVGEKVFENGSAFEHGAPVGSVTLFEKKLTH